MIFYVIAGAGPGDWCPTEESESRLYVGTLEEAAAIVRQIRDPHYQREVLVRQVEIETDKATLARVLNDEGGYERATPNAWGRGPRGGLQRLTESELADL